MTSPKRAQTFDFTTDGPDMPALFKHSFKAVFTNKGFLVVYMAFNLLIAMLAYYVRPTGFGYQFSQQQQEIALPPAQIFIPLVVVGILVTLVLTVVFVRYALACADGEVLRFKDYFKPVKRVLPLIVAQLLVSILILLGLVLLIVPGLFLIARFYLLQYVIVDKRKGIIDSIKHSFRMTKGHAWKIWLFILVTISLGIAAMVVFGAVPILRDLASNLLSLIFIVAGANLYRWIEAHQTIETAQ